MGTKLLKLRYVVLVIKLKFVKYQSFNKCLVYIVIT